LTAVSIIYENSPRDIFAVYGNGIFSAVIFDLDNTLYSRKTGLFTHISSRINTYIQTNLGLPPEEASVLREWYKQAYGLTLTGLMGEHGSSPEGYVAVVPLIPGEEILGPDPPLETMLREVPQPKYIFTNGSLRHAERVLRCLGIQEHFSEIFDITFTGYSPKPEARAYRCVLEAISRDPEEVVFVDDLQHNLVAAGRIGMTTVLVHEEASRMEGIDYAVSDLAGLAELFRSILPAGGETHNP
jgi:putative hydrolase of the HAD superfamily